jgi:hypothetical protein
MHKAGGISYKGKRHERWCLAENTIPTRNSRKSPDVSTSTSHEAEAERAPKDETIHQRLYRKGNSPPFLLHILSTKPTFQQSRQQTCSKQWHGSDFLVLYSFSLSFSNFLPIHRDRTARSKPCQQSRTGLEQEAAERHGYSFFFSCTKPLSVNLI